MITLFPPSIEHHRQTNSLAEYLADVSRYDKKHEWVQQKKIFGKTSENYHIVFTVADAKRNYNGFFSFPVIWYCCYVGENSLGKIDGMKIASPEVDYFYSPRNALEQSAEIDEDTGNLKELSVGCKKGSDRIWGYIQNCARCRCENRVCVLRRYAFFAGRTTN